MKGFLKALDLSDITLVCQDWGSLIGLRVVAENHPAFMFWVRHCDAHPDFHPGEIMSLMTQNCDEEEKRAWAAPVPSEEYLAGPRQFPTLVPISPDNPAVADNRAA